ncbi:nuclease-related domain-containing protein [Streptomyces cremeus]|uniref:Nuclease-related domain-containing protein n=1 Tax=Streptomyces cremeus TaxID=66881 RepID=A0ABV5P8T7_STRCM
MGDELQIKAWRRYGHDRLYVLRPDGLAVAWMDRKTGEVTFLRPEYREAVLAALADYQAPPPPTVAKAPRSSPQPQYESLPPLTPDHDLARNRAGANVRDKIQKEKPAPVIRLLDVVLRRPSHLDTWRTGYRGEQLVGAELARLTSHGWHVLHAVPLPREVDIDHLLIGPGGVFSINTKRHPDKVVWVGNDAVRINHGPPHPYLRKSRAEARRVQRVLTRYCDVAVQVQPVLVFVGTAELVREPTLLDVRVYREREVSALGPLDGVLDPEQVERVFAVARHRLA